MKGGKLNISEFGARMRGEGEYWQMIVDSFNLHCRRLGMNRRKEKIEPQRHTFRRPSAQPSLFD